MLMRYALSRRDGLLVLFGASCVSLLSSLFNYSSRDSSSIIINTLSPQYLFQNEGGKVTPTAFVSDSQGPPSQIPQLDFGLTRDLPETSIVAHAPGWTLFRNLYMSNGTLFILTSQDPSPEDSGFPEIRMMTSTGLPAENTPENIALREPTQQEMDFLAPEEARRLWGGDIENGQRNRVWSVEGNTLLYNDPSQFLNHYYHFVAELLLGTWAFLYGAFNPSSNLSPTTPPPNSLAAALGQPSFNLGSPSAYQPPPFTRAIFIHSSGEDWRDGPGFNAYFLHAAFPALAVEVSADWADRVAVTVPPAADSQRGGRAWHFPLAMLVDRSAAHRGVVCGSQTQRTAAEAWDLMVRMGGIDRVGDWWGSVRGAVARFAGAGIRHEEIFRRDVDGKVDDAQWRLPLPEKIVITYINRQGVRRHLIQEDHDLLVASLEEMVERKREEGKEWELNIVQPEKMSKDEQVELAAKTTILLGVHGNGLTHLVLMQPTRLSAVIEIFIPGGFARDYEWTTRALGMRHFSVWNDTHFTHPNEPELDYPEGFQGTSIPAYGPAVTKLIEDRLEERL